MCGGGKGVGVRCVGGVAERGLSYLNPNKLNYTKLICMPCMYSLGLGVCTCTCSIET
jgi:hypothetical protein